MNIDYQLDLEEACDYRNPTSGAPTNNNLIK